MRRLALAVFLSCSLAALPAMALDRNAFIFTRYDLQVTLDPHQHGLVAEGTVEVRNVSQPPQREVSLQISSSLRWLSVLAEGGASEVEWLEQSYTSDIDHTGLLDEAIVKLEKPVAPGESLRLNVRYSGTVQKDTTRLERIGTPADIARRSDWDEISDSFTALRGAGFVVWYPVSMDAANLSQGNELFEITARLARTRGFGPAARAALTGGCARGRRIKIHLRGQWLAIGRRVAPGRRGDQRSISRRRSGDCAARRSGRNHRPAAAWPPTTRRRTRTYARDYMAAAETVIPAAGRVVRHAPAQGGFGGTHRPERACPTMPGAYYFVPMRNVPPRRRRSGAGASGGPYHAGFAAAVDSRGAGRLRAGVDSRAAGRTPRRPRTTWASSARRWPSPRHSPIVLRLTSRTMHTIPHIATQLPGIGLQPLDHDGG